MPEQFEAANSARPSDDALNQSLTNSCNDVSITDQKSVLTDMRLTGSTASLYLPDFHIEGGESSLTANAAAVQADNRNNGALGTAREYWQDSVDDSVKQGGISGFANYLWGNTMSALVEGVQTAVDARNYWSDAERDATNPLSAIFAAGMHDILVPAAVLDHIGSATNQISSASVSQVESGLKQGVLKGSYAGPEQAANALEWLDKAIPNDGTAATVDRRTALLVSVASAEAQKVSSDPKQKEEIAYDRLFALRSALSSYEKQLPEGMRGRELDADVAAAEHFFEVSRRVAADTMEMGLPGVGNTEVPANGYVTAPVWATIGAGYAIAKRMGILGGSQAGEHQTSWEMAGIMRGLEINRR